MIDDRNKQIGVLATIIFHVVLVILIVVYGFVTPLPLPEEEGVLINFGTDAVGKGEVETMISPQPAQPTPPPPKSAPETAVASNKGEKEVMTQDYEETARIEEQKRKEREKKAEEDRKRREEEQVRKQREEEERRRREEEQRIAEQKRRIEESTRSAFGQAATNATSDGTGNAFGNQGDPKGSPDSRSYTGGQGAGSEGIGYNLTGRTPQGGRLPAPQYTSNQDGVVVIKVKVDRSGSVIEAEFQPKGSTITDLKLRNAALQAARMAKFNPDPNAEPIQVGEIIYRFYIR